MVPKNDIKKYTKKARAALKRSRDRIETDVHRVRQERDRLLQKLGEQVLKLTNRGDLPLPKGIRKLVDQLNELIDGKVNPAAETEAKPAPAKTKAAEKAPAKKAPAKKAPAKKATAKKATAKKATAKKAPAKKAPAKKAAAKKAPAKKVAKKVAKKASKKVAKKVAKKAPAK